MLTSQTPVQPGNSWPLPSTHLTRLSHQTTLQVLLAWSSSGPALVLSTMPASSPCHLGLHPLSELFATWITRAKPLQAPQRPTEAADLPPVADHRALYTSENKSPCQNVHSGRSSGTYFTSEASRDKHSRCVPCLQQPGSSPG